jgi:uncharacterized protein YlaI
VWILTIESRSENTHTKVHKEVHFIKRLVNKLLSTSVKTFLCAECAGQIDGRVF